MNYYSECLTTCMNATKDYDSIIQNWVFHYWYFSIPLSLLFIYIIFRIVQYLTIVHDP